MITPGYCQMMARYNAWQNHSLFTAAATLDDAAREEDRGAFWGSVRATLSHLMWGDLMWISRFDGGEGPVNVALGAESPHAYDWDTLWIARPKLDARIAAWAWSVSPDELNGDLSWYSGFLKADMTRSMALCREKTDTPTRQPMLASMLQKTAWVMGSRPCRPSSS